MCNANSIVGPSCSGTLSGTELESPRVAIESLTATEAAWHIVVFGLFVTSYIFVASWARYSFVFSLAIFAALGVAAAGGAAAVPTVSKALRADALRALRAAVAGGDPQRICAAIKHAQAVGVSAKEAATTEELRVALWRKLRSAMANGDARRVSAAVHCARAVDLCREVTRGCSSRAASAQLGADAPKARATPTPPLTRQSARPLGLTAEEVAFAEEILSGDSSLDEDSGGAHARSGGHAAISSSYIGDDMAPSLPALSWRLDVPEEAEAERALRELHAAIEACCVARMREAIRDAKAASVGADEIAFAEAVLQIESSRELQASLQALRRAAAGNDVGRLRAAFYRAKAAGAGAEELCAADAAIQALEARTPAPAPSALAGRGERAAGSGPKKKVTFADSATQVCPWAAAHGTGPWAAASERGRRVGL